MPASAACKRFAILPAQTSLEFIAKSTLHSVRGTVRDVHGYVDAAWNDRELALEPAPSMHVEFPVERLRSGNEMADREMHKRFDSKRHPTVVADLRELRSAGAGRYNAAGDITLAGRTHRYQGELNVALAGERVTVDGRLPLDMRHFNISPPRLLMLTVDPLVAIQLHLVAVLASPGEGS